MLGIRALFLGCMLICLSGCGRRSLSSIADTEREQFTAEVEHNGLTILSRLLKHEEIMRYFSSPEELYHYYYVMQLRIINNSYIRYTIQGEGHSFFVLPTEMLRAYTRYSYGGGGVALSFLNAILFFPVYAISMLKSAVEAPAYLAEPNVVVPRSFATLSLLYAGIVLLPSFIGMLSGNSRSNYAFREANRYILTQGEQFSWAPFSTENVLILTPRAGFQTPCELALYNHKSHEIEKIPLPIRVIW